MDRINSIWRALHRTDYGYRFSGVDLGLNERRRPSPPLPLPTYVSLLHTVIDEPVAWFFHINFRPLNPYPPPPPELNRKKPSHLSSCCTSVIPFPPVQHFFTARHAWSWHHAWRQNIGIFFSDISSFSIHSDYPVV